MIQKIWRFIWGYVVVELRGYVLEKLLNRITSAGVQIWDIKRIKEGVRFKMAARDFYRLRAILRYRKCSVRICEKQGLPFIKMRTFRRQALVLGIILFLGLLKALSSFLWFIQINGTEHISMEDIEQIVLQEGIHRGIPLSSVDLKALEVKILNDKPQIAWVDASLKGTMLSVKVVEKKLVFPDEVADIIANHSGVITQLIVCRGKAVVKEGDTVKEGELLIKASSKREAFAEPDIEGNLPPYLPEEEGVVEGALGIVKAHTWYEGYGEVLKNVEKELETGRRVRSTDIKIGKKSFHFAGPEQVDFKHYKVEKQVKSMTIWRNIELPIEIINEEYVETVIYKEKRSLERAHYLATDAALNSILNSLTPGAIIIQAKSFLINEGNGDTNIVRVKVLIEVEEDIAKPLPRS